MEWEINKSNADAERRQLNRILDEIDATKQPADDDLTAIADLTTDGIIVRTGDGTAATRTIQGPQSVAVTNGDGVAGDPSLALVGDVTTPLGFQAYGMSPTTGKGWYFPALFESTGILSGFQLSINGGDNTKFDIASGYAGFVDYATSVINPPRTVVAFGGLTAQTVTNLATQLVTYVGLNSSGTVVQQATPFTNTQRRTIAQIGVLVHTNMTNLNAVNDTAAVVRSGINQLYDLISAIGPLNLEGNVVSANGTNMSIDKTAGVIFKLGADFQTNPLDPHNVELAALTAPANIRYRMSDGTETANTSVLLPTDIESPLGTLVTMSNPNKFSVQRLSIFTSNLIRVQYGQDEYDTLEDAERAIPTQLFTVEQNIKENGIPVAYIIMRRSTTALDNTADVKIIPISKFGSVGSGGAAITAATVITALGYTPQPTDSDLTTIAGLTPSNDDFMQYKAGAWANRTIAQVKTDLNLAGTNTGDQTITLTGDVTGSGTGSFATTLATTQTAAHTWSAIQTFTEDIKISGNSWRMVQTTADGADTGRWSAGSGGGLSTGRGAYIVAEGCEATNPGRMAIVAGVGGDIVLTAQTAQAVRPNNDNTVNCGSGSFRWAEVFAGNGTINTSDARLKTEVRPFTKDELAAATALANEVGFFRFIASIERKGDNAREHCGLTVQRAIEVMQLHGLDPMHYGFICLDEWDDVPEELDEDGNVVQDARKAGFIYSFRPDQLDRFITQGILERLQQLELRIQQCKPEGD